MKELAIFKRERAIRIITIIAVVVVGLLVISHCLVSVENNHVCPYCGKPIEYEGPVMKNGNTMYRYVCTETPWHYTDMFHKIDLK